MDYRRYNNWLFAVAIAIYLVTAWASNGFYQADEHYQIIEFAGLKLGWNEAADIPWEFHEKIRSAFQPAIVYAIFRILSVFGIEDPYSRTFLLRLLTAAFALLAIRHFTNSHRGCFDEKQFMWLMLLSYFLWFLPYLNVRFSSETWSGLCLLMANSFLSRQGRKRAYYISGALLGLAFLFRYQTAIAGLSVLLWLLMIRKESTVNLLRFISSGFLAIGLGCIVDYWFYGGITFPFLNYFYITVIHDSGSGFGVDPWYFYFLRILNYPVIPIGILMLSTLLIFIYMSWRNVICWIVVPYIIVHSFIPHKELRFLFPLVNFIPVMAVYAHREIETISLKFLEGKWVKKAFIGICIPLVLINTMGLTAMATKPAGVGRTEICRFIHNRFKNEGVRLYYPAFSNPYNPWNNQAMRFYLEDNVEMIEISSICDLDTISADDGIKLLALRMFEQNSSDCYPSLEHYNFRLLKKSVPDWMMAANEMADWMPSNEVLTLFWLESKKND